MWELKWKLQAKNEYTCGNNISRIYLENIRKLWMSQLQNYFYKLGIKLGQFTWEELDLALRKIKNRKAAGLDEIPQMYGRQGNSTIYLSDIAIEHNRQMSKELHPPFPHEGWPRISEKLPRYDSL